LDVPKQKSLVSDLLASAVKPEVAYKRRPDLPLTKEAADAIWKAVQAKGGELIIGLSDAVYKLGLPEVYAKRPDRSYLLASSLQKILQQKYRLPIRCGSKSKGTYLAFTTVKDLHEFAAIRGGKPQ